MNEQGLTTKKEDGAAAPTGARRHLRWLLPLALIAAGIIAAVTLVATKPHARRARPQAQARLVEAREAVFADRNVVIEANGTVSAARQVSLQPQVSGEVVELADEFLPGGVIAAGETVLRIDPADYELALKQRESELRQAEAAYAIELGQQDVARQEYALLGEDISEQDRDLVLRVPQLEQAEATMLSARAAVAQAELNLDRTVIRAPFNALVRTRDVVHGTRVGTGTQLGSLVGSDEYWIEVVVPVDRLGWIEIPGNGAERGSPVRVYDEAAWGADGWREGRVLKLAADLEQQGRMARLIVSVTDPLALEERNAGRPALLIGSYVRVEITGVEARNVAVLERDMLRDGDNVWVIAADGTLDIRPVEVVYRDREEVLVAGGIEQGEKLVVTDLAAAVRGMALRTADAGSDSGAPQGAAAGGRDAGAGRSRQ